MKTKLFLALIALLGMSTTLFGEEVVFYGYKIDPSKPDVESIKKDAESGNAVAQFVYGGLHMIGNGVPQDKTEGIKWVRKSAENGFAFAQAALGACYYDGNGVPKDKEKALEWLRKAVKNGFSEAQKIIDDIEGKDK
ncbi:MAG: sel1 repeat family protein [Thermoguttaceae bacterium]|nr:sel1 repeat family protein [Thermoguttaceae bacterium]